MWNSAWTSQFWPLGAYNSAAVEENAQIAYNLLRADGWEHNPAIAVIGNLIHESTGINPGQWQGGYFEDWSGGFGIAQWTPGTKVSNYIGSQAQGVVDDGDKQMDLLMHDWSQWSTIYLQPDGSSPYYGLTGLPYITSQVDFAEDDTSSVDDLTAVWMVCWERPAAQYAGLAARQQYAQYYDGRLVYNEFPLWMYFQWDKKRRENRC